MPRFDHPAGDEVVRLEAKVEKLTNALNSIAAREPDFDTLPLDLAFRTLREITKIARAALQ